MNFALGCNHDEDDTQTGNELIANIFDESIYAEDRKLPCGRRTPDGDTRPHLAAMAEMQQLLNRLIAKHTRSLADWRPATAEGHEGQPAYGDIQAATGIAPIRGTPTGGPNTLCRSY